MIVAVVAILVGVNSGYPSVVRGDMKGDEAGEFSFGKSLGLRILDFLLMSHTSFLS